MRRLFVPVLLCATLGLAPHVPEPHIVGKLRWLMGGGEGMTAKDIFDVFLHGAPWIWLGYRVVSMIRTGARPDHDVDS